MKRKKIIFAIIAACNFFPALVLAAFSYTPMEAIPGFGKPADFPTYIMAVYKFGLWTIGISAMLMIVLGGYMYLVSAGNASQTGKAKGVIADAIVGLILALVSWLLLYTINPDLVQFNIGQTTSTPAPNPTPPNPNPTPPNPTPPNPKPNPNPLANCSNLNPALNSELQNASSQSGVPTSVLAAFMQRECTPAMSNPNACSSNNSYGAGGSMQFTDPTWNTYKCSGSKFNRQDALNCAAKKIAKDSGGDYSDAGLAKAAKRYCGSCTDPKACGGDYCDGIIRNNNAYKSCAT